MKEKTRIRKPGKRFTTVTVQVRDEVSLNCTTATLTGKRISKLHNQQTLVAKESGRYEDRRIEEGSQIRQLGDSNREQTVCTYICV